MKWEITVQTTIRKTYQIEADDPDRAIEMAHEMFTVEPDGDEYYNQEAVDIERLV